MNTTIVKSEDENIECPILEAFGLPASMVYGYIQPYDPVVRLFSGHDVLYPLVDDLGADGNTLYSTVSVYFCGSGQSVTFRYSFIIRTHTHTLPVLLIFYL